MICKNCGKQIKDGVSFCPHCGKPVNNKSENISKGNIDIIPDKPIKSWKIPALIGGVGVLVVLVVVISVSALKSDKAEPNIQTNVASDKTIYNEKNDETLGEKVSTVDSEEPPETSEPEKPTYTVTDDDLNYTMKQVVIDVAQAFLPLGRGMSSVEDVKRYREGFPNYFISNYDNQELRGISSIASFVGKNSRRPQEGDQFTVSSYIIEKNYDNDGFTYFDNSSAELHVTFRVNYHFFNDHDSRCEENGEEKFSAIFVLENGSWKIRYLNQMNLGLDYTHIDDENKKSSEELVENFNELSDWQKAYIDYLNEADNTNDEYRYSLVFIDDNDIPELLIYTGYYRYAIVDVLTYYDNKVHKLVNDNNDGNAELGSYGSLKIADKTGVIASSYDGSEVHSEHYFQLKEGKLKVLHSFSEDYMDGNYSYSVDGADVSEQEFIDKKQESASKYNLNSYDYENGEELNTIIQKVTDWSVSTSTKQASSQNSGQDQDYILPDCDSRYYSQEELEALGAEQLKLARNEIYARHGYIFHTGDTKNYFDSKSWYRGTVTEVTDDMLNEYEIANRDLIISIENK